VRAVVVASERSRTSTVTRMEVVNLFHADGVATAETKNNGMWVSKQGVLVLPSIPAIAIDVQFALNKSLTTRHMSRQTGYWGAFV